MLYKVLQVKIYVLIIGIFVSNFACRAQAVNKNDSLLLLISKASSESEKTHLLSQIADSCRDKELYREALKYYQQLLPIYELQHDTSSVALVLKNIGKTHSRLFDLDKAIDYSLRALKIYEAINDTNECISVLNDLGSAYTSCFKEEKALEYLMMSYELSLNSGNDEALCNALNNIGIIYLVELEDHRKALEYFEESLQVAKKIDDTTTISVQFQNIAQVYLNLEKYDSALMYFSTALSIDEKNNYKLGIASNCCNMANLFIKTNNIEKAGEFLDRSLIIAKEIGSKGLQRVIYNLYTLYFAINGNLDEMWRYAGLGDAMQDSLYSDRSEKKIAEMQTKYETDKKEQQIAMLSMENELNESKLRISLLWLKISILALVSIIIFILMKRQLFYTQKHLVRKNLEIVESEKRIVTIPLALLGGVSDEKPYYSDQSNVIQNKYTGSQLSKEQKTEIMELLNDYFSKSKNYLNKDYSISDMANDLDINKNYLSQVINEKFHQNFNSLVNERRIKEARKIMSDEINKKYTIEYVAGEVGYKSRTAFNNAFKKYVGVTPSFYLKSIQSK